LTLLSVQINPKTWYSVISTQFGFFKKNKYSEYYSNIQIKVPKLFFIRIKKNMTNKWTPYLDIREVLSCTFQQFTKNLKNTSAKSVTNHLDKEAPWTLMWIQCTKIWDHLNAKFVSRSTVCYFPDVWPLCPKLQNYIFTWNCSLHFWAGILRLSDPGLLDQGLAFERLVLRELVSRTPFDSELPSFENSLCELPFKNSLSWTRFRELAFENSRTRFRELTFENLFSSTCFWELAFENLLSRTRFRELAFKNSL
jgi:hypothetical protein